MGTILVSIMFINKQDSRVNHGNRDYTFIEAHRFNLISRLHWVYSIS